MLQGKRGDPGEGQGGRLGGANRRRDNPARETRDRPRYAGSPVDDSKGTSLVSLSATSKGAMPSGPEQLRLRLTIMQNALLMIGLQHPGRAELKDNIDFQLFEKDKDYLLGDYCYGL